MVVVAPRAATMAMEQSSCVFNAFIVFLLIVLEEAIALLRGQTGMPALA
jgi:hypothetical protein